MADAVPQQQYAAPAPVTAGATEQYIQTTPKWVVIVRGFQFFWAIVILGLAGYLIHGHAMGAHGFAVVCGLFTWIVVLYTLITEKVPSANKGYNIWAVLALDFLMALFWLACLGSTAALRVSFNQRVTVTGCYNDGSAVNSNHCTYAKRAAVADEGGLAIMSAIPGLSAINWYNALLFIATLVFHGHTYRLWHQEHKKPSVDNATYSDAQQYQSQMYPPQPDTAAEYQKQQAAVATYPVPPQQQQQAPYGYPDPNAQQYAQHPAYISPHGTPAPEYNPHGTPAPGQPYYPPQQQQPH
ncbi:hypothetical protein N0V88_007241 [Collariella sp. IMI 366227]|nr:hypothetical protein N0V88_007241 [Collariella sp. IMI 366227]